jgi:hypothetical protein
MPIYLGCKNIDNYFDDIIKITGNIDKDILLLTEIIKNPEKYYKSTYNEKNIKKVNLIENIETLYS